MLSEMISSGSGFVSCSDFLSEPASAFSKDAAISRTVLSSASRSALSTSSASVCFICSMSSVSGAVYSAYDISEAISFTSSDSGAASLISAASGAAYSAYDISEAVSFTSSDSGATSLISAASCAVSFLTSSAFLISGACSSFFVSILCLISLTGISLVAHSSTDLSAFAGLSSLSSASEIHCDISILPGLSEFSALASLFLLSCSA